MKVLRREWQEASFRSLDGPRNGEDRGGVSISSEHPPWGAVHRDGPSHPSLLSLTGAAGSWFNPSKCRHGPAEIGAAHVDWGCLVVAGNPQMVAQMLT